MNIFKSPKKKYKRNRNSQFFYLPYPTFICQEFIREKSFFKCFGCRKSFPTQYRLSRHFLETKCLQKHTKIETKNFPKRLYKRHLFSSGKINDSSLLTVQTEYDMRKKNKNLILLVFILTKIMKKIILLI